MLCHVITLGWHFSETFRNLFLFLSNRTDACIVCLRVWVKSEIKRTHQALAANRGDYIHHSLLCALKHGYESRGVLFVVFSEVSVSQQRGGKTLMPPRMRNERTNSRQPVSQGLCGLCSHLCVSKSEWVVRVRLFAPDRYTHTLGSRFSDWAHAALHLASLARFSQRAKRPPACSLSALCAAMGQGLGAHSHLGEELSSQISARAEYFMRIARQLER